MTHRKPITMWNLLALLAVIIGVIATLGLDQMRMEQWAATGQRRPLGDWYGVDLPAGPMLVYYESPVSAAQGNVDMNIRVQDGDYIHALPPDEDINYRTWFSGRSARALWEIEVPHDGPYVFRAENDNIPLFDEDRSRDRIVFGKRPNSLAEVMKARRVIQIGGASATLLAALVLYIFHGLELKRREQAEQIDRGFP